MISITDMTMSQCVFAQILHPKLKGWLSTVQEANTVGYFMYA